MRVKNSSLGASGPKCGQRPVGPDDPRPLTAGGTRGPLSAGAGSKGPAEQLRTEQAAEGGPLIYSIGITE
jgi:hypothetical protein